ncbi:hypothetical protein CA51_36670 [Rosistilla oblonga]|uniref:hypothetical protein n=1 Tax=Rosistilla oblonga TaxID=2527990 RepID=UPI001188D7B6|nr:hypothetical protein [Rosistilla oblonga]QDV13776.1 hypothetical protein CA51_36670 [Rosistilla oblonga]
MSSSAEGSSDAPLLPPTRRTAPIDPIASWHSSRSGRRGWQWSSRWNLLIGGVFAATALTAVLTWATTSIGRAPQVCVMLASTDYHANLDLPPNAMGDRAIGRLSAWVTGGDVGLRRDIQLARPPLELSNRSAFDRISTDRDAAISLIYLSAHGIHTPQGPALLAADAQSSDDAYPVKDLLDQIAKFPASQKKVLLLDCVHFQSHESLGILLNDFARQMRDLDSVIQAIPNLVVVMSSDIHQQSWINPAAGITNWGDALVDALNGLAKDLDRDGWIDLLEVHRCAADRATAWSAKVCQQPQHPVLLPLGKEGENRTRNLGLFPDKTPAIDIPAFVSPTNNDRIDKWWSRYDEMVKQQLHPAAKSPATWRRFERTLLRYEHFERAGCSSAAGMLNEHLGDLAKTLQKPTRFDSIACRAGVLSPEMIGFEVTSERQQNADQLAAVLSGMSLDDATDHWLSIASSQSSAADVAFLRRTVIQRLSEQTVAAFRAEVSVDRKRLQSASALVAAVTDPLQPIPQLGRVLQFLARDLPSEPLGSSDATRIARFLELSTRSDRVANDGLWWSPELVSWVEAEIASSDQQRRFAGDLLFGEQEARQRAQRSLDAAEKGYARVDQIGRVVNTAQSIVHRGGQQLARLCELIASIDSDNSRDLRDVASLYQTVDQIDAILKKEVPANSTQRTATLSKLQSLTQQYHDRFDTLGKRINAWQTNVLSQPAQSMPPMLAALDVVGSDAATRRSAWESLCRLSAGADATMHTPVAEDLSIAVASIQSAAARRGHLALCGWSAPMFDSLVAGEFETWAEVDHRLQVFATDSKWWDALAIAGYQIGIRETEALRLITTPIKRQTADEQEQLQRRLALLDRMAAIAPFDSRQFVTVQQKYLFANFLAWQTNRFVADGYWSLRAEGPAYFARVAELLAGDIASLSPRVTVPSSPLVHNPQSAVSIHLPSELIWTTQRQDQFTAGVRTMKRGAEGFVTIWVEAEGCLQATQPTAGSRVCRPLIQPTKSTGSGKSTATDNLIVHLERVPGSKEPRAKIQVHGYFRGRQLTETLAATIASTPDVHVVQNPKPLGGRIAIRSATHADHASAGAIALVLDCSGSMGAARGEAFGPNTKYAHAVTAVETLLDDLPSGIKLSVWTFGAAVGEAKTVTPAERSIRRIQAPVVWNPHDRSLRQNLIDAISYPHVEPWNESPLLAAMLAASNDLRDLEGVRSLVVVTDGADNRIANDAVANPLKLTPEQWIRKQFNGTGITVNVIGFRVDDAEKTATEKQLATVEHLLPAGRFVTADQASELAAAMSKMLTVETPISIRHAAAEPSADKATLATVPISPEHAAASWTPQLDAGLYTASTDRSGSGSMIELTDGDQLVLDRTASGSLHLWPTIDKQFIGTPQRQSGRWTIALTPQPISATGIAARRLLLWAPASDGKLAIQRPSELWIEARDGGKKLPIRWQQNHDLSCDSYDIAVQATGAGKPQFQVWTSDRKANSVGALVRNQDFWHLKDLAPASWQLSEGEVRLKSATIETHDVADRSGALHPQPCLVLRGSGPRRMAFRVRTSGLAFEGQDEQCFTELGEFTLRQWPVTSEDVERTLQSVELILVDRVNSNAERAGGKVIFDDKPTPNSVTQHRSPGAARVAFSGVDR